MSDRGFRLVAASLVLAATLALGGCASASLMAKFGPVAPGEYLITLIVSNRLDVVQRECGAIALLGPILGCQKSIEASGVHDIRIVTIVRYAETLPTARTFEIDAHELCHALAAVQTVVDPCHADNGGFVRSRGPWDVFAAP